ncbi:MAG TPA: phage shock protein operon transcriptional activator [Dongiaceae bacterium]|jgi:psp operon transcriptional activator
MGEPSTLPSLIGSDPSFLEALEQVSRLAPLERPALIIGERGTGKELIAERLHYLSRRWDRPLVKINCAALSESLLESELFGHEAGAFTGARARHRGRFERADGGTLFLDEIAAATPRLQEQVLRVIEYGEFERVGGDSVMRADVRVIGATNVDLAEQAERGSFRADLLDRLAFDVITLPPLRGRPADIVELAEAFGLGMATSLGLPVFTGFSETAEAALQAYSWPGNVRELRNVIERSVYRAGPTETPITDIVFDPFSSPWRPNSAVKGAAVKETVSPSRVDHPSLPCDFTALVGEFEAALVSRALAAASGNQAQAAQSLGLGYHQFRRLYGKYRRKGDAGIRASRLS